jgi:predicted CXXCH cytochrome family protein
MVCHDKPIETGKDEVLGAFTAEIENKDFLHGPVAENSCEGCHISHGSEHFRLLAKEYPPQFYAPFSKDNYELCFSCHPESMVLTKETSDLTGFRNGDLNLHFLHVNKERRGRTCRACHQTHASNLSRHIRESVPYGRWDLPIQFKKTETGGGCQPGCHLPFAYDRQTPVVHKRPQPASMTVSSRGGQKL